MLYYQKQLTELITMNLINVLIFSIGFLSSLKFFLSDIHIEVNYRELLV